MDYFKCEGGSLKVISMAMSMVVTSILSILSTSKDFMSHTCLIVESLISLSFFG